MRDGRENYEYERKDLDLVAPAGASVEASCLLSTSDLCG